MQNMRSETHESNVLLVAICTLPVADRSLKHVREFLSGPEETWTYKINHAPVFEKIVLFNDEVIYLASPKIWRVKIR